MLFTVKLGLGILRCVKPLAVLIYLDVGIGILIIRQYSHQKIINLVLSDSTFT